MIFYVDFDGTICPNDLSIPPQPECIEVLNRLRECNNEIYIYSCRANAKCVYDKDSAIRDMVEYLHTHNVPFDDIIHNKPLLTTILTIGMWEPHLMKILVLIGRKLKRH